ncbi:MAG: acyl-CoA dehydrogenase [Rhodospirillaceae bacterium]
MSSETATLLAETAERLFDDHVTRDVIVGAEEGQWPDALWLALEESGLTQPVAPEDRGGLGLAWADALVIVFAAGKSCAPVPLAETMAAGWLLGRAGIDAPSGPLGLAPADASQPVPWGRQAANVICVDGDDVQCLISDPAAIRPDANMAAEPRDFINREDVSVEASGSISLVGGMSAADAVGALVRSAQMAGAAERCIELAVTHAQDRQQFGRPIAKFQAIQHMIAVAAARAAEARVAAEAAFAAMDRVGPDGQGWDAALWDIAAAKVVAGEAAGIVFDYCHQVHGAIGFTHEHELNFATRRLWAWRGEFGSETAWADYLGRRALAEGADNLWPALTAAQAAE